MITTQAKWLKHSEYKGVLICRRRANTGTSGGQWLTVSTQCRTLAQARQQIDRVDESGSLGVYLNKPTPNPTP